MPTFDKGDKRTVHFHDICRPIKHGDSQWWIQNLDRGEKIPYMDPSYLVYG